MAVRGSDVGRDVSMDDYDTYPVDVQAVLEATGGEMPKALSRLGIGPDEKIVTLGYPEVREMFSEVESEFGSEAGIAAIRAVNWDSGPYERYPLIEQAILNDGPFERYPLIEQAILNDEPFERYPLIEQASDPV